MTGWVSRLVILIVALAFGYTRAAATDDTGFGFFVIWATVAAFTYGLVYILVLIARHTIRVVRRKP